MGVKENIAEVIEEFEMFDDWADKYEYIVSLGQEMDSLPEAYRTDKFLVKGCQSQAWMVLNEENGIITIKADSDALIVKGLIAILIQVYSGQQAREIVENPPEFFKSIGLEQHLSPMRSNGLNSMVTRLFNFAKEVASC